MKKPLKPAQSNEMEIEETKKEKDNEIIAKDVKKKKKENAGAGKKEQIKCDEDVEEDAELKSLLKYTKEAFLILPYLMKLHRVQNSMMQIQYRNFFQREIKKNCYINAPGLYGRYIKLQTNPVPVANRHPVYYAKTRNNSLEYYNILSVRDARNRGHQVKIDETNKVIPNEKNNQIKIKKANKKKDSDDDDEDDDDDDDDEENCFDHKNHSDEDDEHKINNKFNEEPSEDDDKKFENKEDAEIQKKNDEILTVSHDSNNFNLTEPASTFVAKLHDYQKQALTWMQYSEQMISEKELYIKNPPSTRNLNPMWEEYSLINDDRIYFNPFSGQITDQFLKAKPTCGGILADEMGLGKTIMTIAHLHTHRLKLTDKEKNDMEAYFDSIKKVYKSKDKEEVSLPLPALKAENLIVVPLSVMSQWEAEIKTHSEFGTMSVMTYYGDERKRWINLGAYGVVLTTYDVLGHEFSSREQSDVDLFAYDWHRVILDEAHYIKGRSTRRTKGACALKSKYRWCLTGTPIQNRLDDLFSIIKFMRMEIWGEYFWWNSYINNHTSNEQAFSILRNILKSIVLRRTKKSTYKDGSSISILPPKVITNVIVELTPDERDIYNVLFKKAKSHFDDIADQGILTREIVHIFELLLRLRQVCNHPSLVFNPEDLKTPQNIESAIMKFLKTHAVNLPDKQKNLNDNFVKETINQVKAREFEACTICIGEMVDPVMTKCAHIFCKVCILQSIEKFGNCPLCRDKISAHDLMNFKIDDVEDANKKYELIDTSGEAFKKSSKLVAILNAVDEIVTKNEKCIIFSQFIPMLRLIERSLVEKKIKFQKLEGSMNQKSRAYAIADFKSDKKLTVFLISLKAGAVGLNLTEANHVFMVDPWWNAAVEDQAIERVHRYGQTKEVRVLRFFCKETIEERIIELNIRKKEFIKAAFQYSPEEKKKQNVENMMHMMKSFNVMG